MTVGSDGTNLWLFFLLCTFIGQIVFLNLLIAIMGDTYDRVKERSEVEYLKMLCMAMYENEILVNRNNLFKDDR